MPKLYLPVLGLPNPTTGQDVFTGQKPLRPEQATQNFVNMRQAINDLKSGLKFKGVWNAATNSPEIPSAATENSGWQFQVAVAGTTSINGESAWSVGDILVSNGVEWQRVPAIIPTVSNAGNWHGTKSQYDALSPADRFAISGGDDKFIFFVKAEANEVVNGIFALPAITLRPIVSPLSMSSLASSALTLPSLTVRPVVSPLNLSAAEAGVTNGTFSPLSILLQPLVAPLTLSSVQNGAMTLPNISCQPVVVPPTMSSVQNSSMTLPSITCRPVVTPPTLVGVVVAATPVYDIDNGSMGWSQTLPYSVTSTLQTGYDENENPYDYWSTETLTSSKLVYLEPVAMTFTASASGGSTSIQVYVDGVAQTVTQTGSTYTCNHGITGLKTVDVTVTADGGGTISLTAMSIPVAQLVAPTITNINNTTPQITLTWNAVPGATSYNIYYHLSTDDSANATLSASLVTDTTYSINGPLTPGSTYYVYVKAVKPEAVGPFSAGSSTTAATAVAYVDDFNRANGGLGTDWLSVSPLNALSIVANTVRITAIGDYGALNKRFLGNNQYAQIDSISMGGTETGCNVLLRANTGSYGKGYLCSLNRSGTTYSMSVYRYASPTGAVGSGVTLTGNAPTGVRWEVTGNTITGYAKIDGAWVQKIQVTDSSGTPAVTGRVGLYFHAGLSYVVYADNFTFGGL